MKRNGQLSETSSTWPDGAHLILAAVRLRDAVVLPSGSGIPPLVRWLSFQFYVFVAAIKAVLFTLAVICVHQAWWASYYYLPYQGYSFR